MPTSSDDVFFDGASGAVTVTTSGTTTDVCNNLDFTGFTGTLSHANNTTIQIYGNLKTVAGMTYTIGGTGAQLSFLATATGKTLTTGGKTWPKLLFDGVGGDWALQDTLNMTNGQTITLTNGTIKFNGQSLGANGIFLSSNNSNTRGLDFTGGTTTWTIGNANTTFWDVATSTGMTVTSASNLDLLASVTSNNGTFVGGGLTWGTIRNTVLTTGSVTINGANTFSTMTLSGGSSGGSYILGANQTVSGTFTSNGTSSADSRAFIKSSVRGTARTITAATVSCSWLDLQDITGAGAGSWDLSAITGGSGDCGGNTSITFTTPASQYWVPSGGTSTGNFNATTRWASSSGGTAGTGRVPLPQDTAVFDANSIDAGSRTITQGSTRIGAVNWTGVTNTPAWTKSSTCKFFGAITLVNGMTQGGTSTYTYEGRSNSTITLGSTTWTNPLVVDCVSGTGTLTLGDSGTSNTTIVITSGTLSGAAKTIGCSTFTVNGGTVNVQGILASGAHSYTAGTVTVGSSGLTGTTFTNSGCTFTLNGASTGMTGNMTLSGGTTTLNANYTTTGTLSISNDCTLNLADATLNTTTINIAGSGVGGGGGASAYTWVL